MCLGWDESSRFVKIYVNIPKCDQITNEQTSCEFTDTSFKLTVKNHDNKNHTLQIVKLARKIKPDASTCKVRKEKFLRHSTFLDSAV